MSKRKAVPKLSELEWEVVKPLWKHGPMAARDIFEKVPEQQGWAYKTVKTMLARLVKKGAIEYQQVGNSYLYRAAFSQEELARDATRSFIRRVFDGAMTPFMAQFMEEVTPEELDALKSELVRLERERFNARESES
ncbi:MAG: BlaI/MecI/CopY family transcriptional regulator [FCB group bacterium]|jgi:BlaI family penicillinase repressor|nr:BlaI/MecI/CopY family transcriptional regulator [FCB group bacterium]